MRPSPVGLSINTRGRLVSERLAWGQATTGDHLEEWIDDGRAIVAELRDAMHGRIDPRSLSEARVRHWQKYGSRMELAAVGMGLPGLNEWLRANPGAAQEVAAEPET